MVDEISSRSESKFKAGEKRIGAQFGVNLERCKKVKMRDLDSVCRSEERIESNRRFLPVDKEKSQEPLKDDVTNSLSETVQIELTGKTVPPVVEPGITSFDLNSEIHKGDNAATKDHDTTLDNSKGFGSDLNADDNKFNSPKENPFSPFKNRENLKSGDVSECGSTTGSLEDTDPMRVWQKMKQNGFLSTSHVSITVPKKRERKSKSDGFKKKMEFAKKEQVDRFAKIAAPSGLLNDLNPGIINYVRNRKQVHSIIEALVRLGKNEIHQDIGKQEILARSSGKDDHISGVGIAQLDHDGLLSTSSMSRRTCGLLNLGMDQSGKDGDLKKAKRWFIDNNSCPLQNKKDRENNILALKLASSTTNAFEDISSLSQEESVNLGCVSSLSVKAAANVAYQWLDLLQQDIRGRLTALKRSKKRVGSVITTELPFLMSREFSGNHVNDPNVVKHILDECSLSENANAHRVKWNAIFDQMDKALSEEEKQLEIWLHQVVKMRIQCDKGLNEFRHHPVNGPRPVISETDHRLLGGNNLESKYAVRAAAASIYSTCNFLSSGDLPCY